MLQWPGHGPHGILIVCNSDRDAIEVQRKFELERAAPPSLRAAMSRSLTACMRVSIPPMLALQITRDQIYCMANTHKEPDSSRSVH
jgi:hypothetical protein